MSLERKLSVLFHHTLYKVRKFYHDLTLGVRFGTTLNMVGPLQFLFCCKGKQTGGNGSKLEGRGTLVLALATVLILIPRLCIYIFIGIKSLTQFA